MTNKYLNEGKYFYSNGLQNNLVIISTRHTESNNSSNIVNSSSNIEWWGYTGMSQKWIKNPHTWDVNFAPKIIGNYKFNSIVEFKGICFKQDSVCFINKNIVELYAS